jgi:regulator of protease activity HflC (stomatin/prohibitin superfamily)
MPRVVLEPQNGFNPKLALGVIVAALIWLVGSLGTYTIQSGSVGILSTFGDYEKEAKLPGLHFMIPGVQQVKVIDIKMQTAHYEGLKDKPDIDGVIRKPRIVVLDSKNLNIGVEVTVQFTPDAERAKDILVKYGINYFEKLINPIIRDIVRDVSARYQAEEVALKRSDIGDEINRKLRSKFKDLPFLLNDLQIRNIELPKIVRQKIEEVQLAKQEEQRLVMIEKQAKKTQEIKTIEANTKLIEVTTQARADAEKKKIEADAKAFQIEKEASAIAIANKKVAESITSDLIRYEAIKKWKGEYPKMLVSDQKGISMMMQIPKID